MSHVPLGTRKEVVMKKAVYRWTILSMVLLVACGGGSSGGGDGGPSDVDPPFIESTTPEEGQLSVHPESPISFRCSEPLNSSTISDINVDVACDSTVISGTVDYFNQSITFTPSKRMPFSANCTATVYTPTLFWGESEAIGPADWFIDRRTYGQAALLPDGTGVIGWSMGENTNWAIGVTWFQ